eukprot:1534436-Ditylum_brightwellii.AAC.1
MCFILHCPPFPQTPNLAAASPPRDSRIGTVICLRSLSDTGKNRKLQVWRRCHNAAYTGWCGVIISDHSWRPLPVLDRIDAP